MNTHLRTMAAAALLAALVPAQTTDGVAALARAKVIEEQEGDLKGAESAYRALLGDAAASAVHGETALRLGAMLWRLDKKDDAKPFLERAVAAGGDVAAQASAVLQGQGEAGKQAQERLEKARALAQRISDLAWKRSAHGAPDEAEMLALRDLKWLGEAAVQALVERLGDKLALNEGGLLTSKGEPVPDAALFVRTLWEMGTESAQQFLARSAAEGTVDWRRFVTKHAADNVAPDLMPALVRFLHDPDPTGEVLRNLDRVLGTVPVPTLVELTTDAHAGARAAGLAGLASAWRNLPALEQVRIVDVVDAPLRRALRDVEPRPGHAAWRLVRCFVYYGPRAARRLVLGEIA
ncbi:MAG TPA: hypothetical protein VFT55_06255, partial [Planctomycetota bacterium]|nr:hypothetical protein [Planctomycetota bacterium]